MSGMQNNIQKKKIVNFKKQKQNCASFLSQILQNKQTNKTLYCPLADI